jgi:hypothetical protein
MTHSIQFFVRNVTDLRDKELEIDSTYPLIQFATKALAYDFIRRLIAEHAHDMSGEGYLILNNPQLLPIDVRYIHQYSIAKISDDTDNDDYDTVVMDGCFSIERNIDLLKNVTDQIDNNNLGGPGFREFLQNYPNTLSQL